MKRSYKSKKTKKKISEPVNNQTESQFINITTNCDGYAQVSPEKIDDYKSVYFHVNKGNEVLFPFIYFELYNRDGFRERVIINVKKNELIEVKDGKKNTISF